MACFHQFCLSQIYNMEKINCIMIFDNNFSTYLCAQLCLTVTPWTRYMGFFRQVYWSRLSFPILGDLPDLGIEPTSQASPALASRFFTIESPGKPNSVTKWYTNKFKFFHILMHLPRIECLIFFSYRNVNSIYIHWIVIYFRK